MKTKLLFFLLVCIAPYQLQAQVFGDPAGSVGSGGGGDGMRIASIPKPPNDLGDAIYLTPGWEKGSIYLLSGQYIKTCTLRCDLGNKFIEIKDKDIIRGIPFAELKQFQVEKKSGVLVDFLSGHNFLIEGERADGIYEVLIIGKEPLLLRTAVEIIKSNGGFTDLQRGDEAIKTLRTEKYYILYEKNLVEIKGLSSLVTICGERGEDVKLWAKKNKKKTKKKEDVIDIWNYYLSLSQVQN